MEQMRTARDTLERYLTATRDGIDDVIACAGAPAARS